MLRVKSLALTVVMSLISVSAGLGGTIEAGSPEPGLSGRSGSSAVGLTAPNFRLTDLSGRQVELNSLRGKVVIIDFWASWCGPCRYSMPRLESLHREFKDRGLVVLAVNIEDPDDARAFLERNPFTFKVLSDADGRIAGAYGVEAIPTMFMIGADGRIIAHHVGVQTEETLRADLAKAGIQRA